MNFGKRSKNITTFLIRDTSSISFMNGVVQCEGKEMDLTKHLKKKGHMKI